MKQFIGSLLFLIIPLLTAYGQEVNGTSTVTFGLGAGKPANPSYFGSGITGGTQLNGSFEYRFRKHFSFEFGVDSTLVTAPRYTYTNTSVTTISPTGVITTGTYSNTYTYSTAGARATAMPFGFRALLPLRQGRLEAVAGGGGVHLWNPQGYYYNSGGWGWQANLSIRMALDQKRRFWLGSTGRFMDVNGANPSQWVVWSADLSYRFGGR